MRAHVHTVQLDPAAYRLLKAEADRRHVTPDTLAGKFVRERLATALPMELSP